MCWIEVAAVMVCIGVQVVDFSLSREDMDVLTSFERGWRCCVPKIVVDGEEVPRDRAHPHYPFSEPF